MSAGWQQAPVLIQPVKPKCPHFGLLGAVFTLSQHPPGHEWVCVCGKHFVVVTGDGGKKLEARP